MATIDETVQIFPSLTIQLSFEDLAKSIKSSGNSPELFKLAESLFEKMLGKWKPAALFKWFEVGRQRSGEVACLTSRSGRSALFDLGCSVTFLNQARYVMVAAYTIGETLINNCFKCFPIIRMCNLTIFIVSRRF